MTTDTEALAPIFANLVKEFGDRAPHIENRHAAPDEPGDPPDPGTEPRPDGEPDPAPETAPEPAGDPEDTTESTAEFAVPLNATASTWPGPAAITAALVGVNQAQVPAWAGRPLPTAYTVGVDPQPAGPQRARVRHTHRLPSWWRRVWNVVADGATSTAGTADTAGSA